MWAVLAFALLCGNLAHGHRAGIPAHRALGSRPRAGTHAPLRAYGRGGRDEEAPNSDDEYAARRAGGRARAGGSDFGGAERAFDRRGPPRGGGGSSGPRSSPAGRAPFGERGRPAREGSGGGPRAFERSGPARFGSGDGANRFRPGGGGGGAFSDRRFSDGPRGGGGGRPIGGAGGGGGGAGAYADRRYSDGPRGGGGRQMGGAGSGGGGGAYADRRFSDGPRGGGGGRQMGGAGGGGGGGSAASWRGQPGAARWPQREAEGEPPRRPSAADVFGRAPAAPARRASREQQAGAGGAAWGEEVDEEDEDEEVVEDGWEGADEGEEGGDAYAGGELGEDLSRFDDDAFDSLEGAAAAPRPPPLRNPAAAEPGGGGYGADAASPSRAAPPADFVYGISPVLAALRAGRRVPSTLYVQDSLAPKARRDASDLAAALGAASDLGVRVTRLDKGELNNMARNRPHQGLVLTASALPELALDALPPTRGGAAASGPPPVWLALDEIQDPQNMGALLRSAHFLGASGVLLSAKNSAPLSAATSKASAGAMEVMEVHATSNLVRTLRKSRENGWRVVGAALGKPGSTVASHELAHGGQPTILVLGNEGKGLRTLVKRECDVLVAIPGQIRRALAVAAPAGEGAADGDGGDDDEADDGAFEDESEADWEDGDEPPADEARAARPAARGRGDGGGGRLGRDAVDSLNVSVAGAILLHQLLVSAADAAGEPQA